MITKLFFRVSNIDTGQGLWYDSDGTFSGLIHSKFKFCANSDLPMPFDSELVGWLSVTEQLSDIWHWFTKEDVHRLQQHGWYVHGYHATVWKDHENHQVIDVETSRPIFRLEVSSEGTVQNVTQVESPQRVALTQN